MQHGSGNADSSGKEVTIKDVARLAKVSQSTVSLVVNDRPAVGTETRERVLKAIKELGYEPSRAAREIVTKRSQTIGIMDVIPTHESSSTMADKYGTSTMIPTFAYDVARGIEEEAQRRGYGLLFATHYGELSGKWKELPPMITHRLADGLLLIGGGFSDEFLRSLKPWKIPVVLVGGHMTSGMIDCVYADAASGTEAAITYLFALGHTRVGFVNGPKNTQVSSDKMRGYLGALHQQGLEFDPSLVAEGDFSAQSGREATHALLKRHPDLHAIYVGFDGMAIGSRMAILERKLRIPDDVSLIGYEDGWIATHFDPPLTTVKVFKHEIGIAACEMLFDLMFRERTGRPRSLIIPTELVLRETCQATTER